MVCSPCQFLGWGSTLLETQEAQLGAHLNPQTKVRVGGTDATTRALT